MFEHYTEKARRVIFFARYEASQFGSDRIETEHILLGLLREDKELAARFFSRLTTIDALRKEIEGRIVVHKRESIAVELALAPSAKRALDYAIDESKKLNQDYLGTEHLLLGLLREDKSMAGEILYEQGLRLDAIREELRRSPHRAANTRNAVMDKFEQSLHILKEHRVIGEDEIQLETKMLRDVLPFQALLNVLARKGVITADEFKSLSLRSKDGEATDSSKAADE